MDETKDFFVEVLSMEPSNSTHPCLTKMRRTLFVGPTGVGKSTLINILMNHKVSVESMTKPAGTSDAAAGQTAYFTTYYDLPHDAYTDSIGFGDSRFDPKEILRLLKLTIKNSSVGYNKIYVCIRYGRIPLEIRNYIDLLIAIFGKEVLKWCSIIFTNCNDQTMTKEKYLDKNSEDPNIATMIEQVQTVLFGNNMVDDEPEVDATVFIKRRRAFLERIQKDIATTANSEYFIPEPENFFEYIEQIIKIIFRFFATPIFGTYHLVTEIKGLVEAVAASMDPSKYSNYFGECIICYEDMMGTTLPVITECNHVFHQVCIVKWVNQEFHKNCPICRTELGVNPKVFYKYLTIVP